MWGQIISGGLGLIGSLFGSKKSSKPQVVENRVDYGRMVREAEAAGFNPLTAIRNGGAAGFSVSTQSHPGLSSSELIGNAFQTAGNVFQAYQDSKVEEKANLLQEKLMNAQLANIQADTSVKMRSLEVPTRTASRFQVGTPGLTSGPGTQADLDLFAKTVNDPQRTFESGNVTVTNPWPRWTNFGVNPNMPDAEMFETRYGDSEIGSMLFGGGTLVGDAYYNIKKYLDGGAADVKKTREGLLSGLTDYFRPSRQQAIPYDPDYYWRQRGGR